MSYEADQIQSLRIALRDLQKDGLVSELRLLRKAIEEQNELKKLELGLNKNSKKILKSAFEKFNLSVRAYTKILKVARTIADLDGAQDIETCHIAEAIQYRNLDRKYWGY